jgi:sugar O-acyltransferase (sialic acid O-acetyltransferase NeuD family)
VTKLIMIGAGGHARVVAEALKAEGRVLAGFVTPDAESGSGVMQDIQRIGSDEDLLVFGPADVLLVNGIGSAGRPLARRSAFERFKAAGFAFTGVVHPSAIIASDVIMGEGAQVMAAAVLQPGVRLGRNALINTGAIVDHDTNIFDHAHVATGARLAGTVTLGEGAHVGAGASVINNVRIGAGAIVGVGAVVLRDVDAGTVVTGVPAKINQ